MAKRSLSGKQEPRPSHVGVPPVHFEKLACTACHSGPWPSNRAMSVKTSRAHGLGIPKIDKTDDALPHIVSPVFAKQENGTYAPHNLIWPAYWAYSRNEAMQPVSPELVRPLLREIVQRDTTRHSGATPVLRDADVLELLQQLHRLDSSRGAPVYVSAGKVFERAPDGTLAARELVAARPYAWPIAHDVRPAAQSLGVRGCDDCHATDAPFYFGSVGVASPFFAHGEGVARMTEYQDQSPVFPRLFSMSFLFRPGLGYDADSSSSRQSCCSIRFAVSPHRTLAAEENDGVSVISALCLLIPSSHGGRPPHPPGVGTR
jgi:hypothetical protein